MKEKQELSTKELIDKALSRANITRVEQKRIGLLLKDAKTQVAFQAKVIKEMKEEIIKLKLKCSFNSEKTE